jgi:hypothetical protein
MGSLRVTESPNRAAIDSFVSVTPNTFAFGKFSSARTVSGKFSSARIAFGKFSTARVTSGEFSSST